MDLVDGKSWFGENQVEIVILTSCQEERDREQWEEFEQTWAKRRRLIREKSELDAGSSKRRESALFRITVV